MPQFPGLLAMPTVLMNAALSVVRDRSYPVRSRDRLAAVLPMFNEEAGARLALTSLLAQRVSVDEIAVSINGGSDRTPEVVAATLRDLGFERVWRGGAPGVTASLASWRRPRGGPPISVIEYPAPTSKAASINLLVESGLVTAERVLVLDGDTALDPGFVASLRDNFYRLRVERAGGRRRFVIDDLALQSGAVTSRRPERPSPAAELIWRARTAEYAFAGVLRRGQSRRLGRGSVFGASRLYTVVGCGFAARRDGFPMPTDTLTEDHDFTLAVQNGGASERACDPATLDARGFRVVVDGAEVAPSAMFDRHDTVTLRRASEARFVTDAVMYTEDPPTIGGYVRQVERWTGGGIENALKRVGKRRSWAGLRSNVRFAFVSAQVENVLGLVLLALLPLLLGLNAALPGLGMPFVGLGAWLGLDLLATLALATLGFVQSERARGWRGARLAARVARSAAGTVLPLFLLKFLNPVCYLTAATRAIPAFLRNRDDTSVTVTWDRPRAPTGGLVPARTAGVALGMALTGLTVFAGAAHLGSTAFPGYRDAWLLTYGGPRIDQHDHETLPLRAAGPRGLVAVVDDDPPPGDDLVLVAVLEPDAHAEVRALLRVVGTERRRAVDAVSPVEVSRFCPPSAVVAAAERPRRLHDGATAYQPLTDWGVLTLARLAPLLAHLEEAATAYDVPAALILQMLINESYLDPLAVGPTDDVGLSQVTSDALTLLRSISTDPASRFANPQLIQEPFSVFDPDFSICAGAAKFAWARGQSHGDDDGVAYARYINPIRGVVRGAVSEQHAPSVQAFHDLRPLVEALAATVAAYRADPGAVTPAERALLQVADDVAAGLIDIESAYRRTAALARDLSISDDGLYAAVLDRLYGPGADELEEDEGTLAAASR
jgi:cellulose synthase/poly-beta-1,6-N-acetylglucosamine synthase-like glycosyltransferase